MIFSSLEFLFIFLPLFLGVYYIAPAAHRNWPLVIGSLLFYSYGVWTQPWAIVLFIALICLGYLAGRLIGRLEKHRRLALAAFLVLLFGGLLSFKYSGLLLENHIALPLGISFYSFQLAAYAVDVYRAKVPAEKSFLDFFAALSLFPKLISGPIAPYESLSRQVRERTFAWQRFDYGLRDFVLGLGMKVLLADQIGRIWKQVESIGFESISTPLAWLGLISFALQLYYDFYGYSLMAIGLGRMIGFRLPKNFVTPYASRSVAEFWRRWHITLGKWFLDYVYIPLGGNKKGRLRELRNLLVVWVLTGIWHGSTINFLLWGLYIFVLLAIEKLWLGKYLEDSGPFAHIYLVFVILLSWVFFAIPELSNILLYFGRLFPFAGAVDAGRGADALRLFQMAPAPLLVGTAIAMPWFMRVWDRIRQGRIGTLILLAIFWFAVYGISAGLNDPFLYFSF